MVANIVGRSGRSFRAMPPRSSLLRSASLFLERFRLWRQRAAEGGRGRQEAAEGSGSTAALSRSVPPSAAPTWSPEATERLSHVPSFVRGMVKKIYREYAVERGIAEITPAIMDRARTELGLEGM